MDSEEITIKFWQEVYDETNILREIHENILLIKDIKKFRMITKKIIADKLLSYLQHRLSLEELVNWAENTLMEAHFEDDNSHTVRDVLAHIGLSDVKAFGLEWKDCEVIMEKLGFKLEVNAMALG